jgi:hypothetical protein
MNDYVHTLERGAEITTQTKSQPYKLHAGAVCQETAAFAPLSSISFV